MKKIRDFIETSFNGNIRARLLIEKKKGSSMGIPEGLSEELKGILSKEGIGSLYSHQHEAFGSISAGVDTLLVSRTASGKTLSFFLPILNEYIMSDQGFSVLLLYPTKALSRDQESTFGRLMEAVKGGNRLGTYDGDTPQEDRKRMERSIDFLITNPDMLHNAILPNNNRKWKSFLSRLRYIVIDEVHIYRGSFGSHVSNVFRRLLRVCEIHGSRPVFVGSSATVGNPAKLAASLFHREFRVIDRDGAPQPERHLYFLNPSLAKSHGHDIYRKGPASISIPLIREAARLKRRTICFCKSRQEAERLYRAVIDGHSEYARVIQPYRGGLLPNERRQLERDLAKGKILVIISTNALELGIDIGDLELCILSGHPGTIASFWQQSGRVGRKGNASVVVFISRDLPIDQYLVHHPDFIINSPVEEALLNADNPYILLQHLPCAAQEHPLRVKEDLFPPRIYEEAVKILTGDKTLTPYHESFRYSLSDYPARGVNLRGMTDYNVEIYCGTEVIGELDPIGARGTLYKDAIYQHLGTKYMSMDLDLEKKLCRVEKVDVDYYTEAVWEGRISLTGEYEKKEIHGASMEYGEMYVNKQPKLYKKIRERSYENIGYGPITLPPFEYNTTGFSILPPGEWMKRMEGEDSRIIDAALYGLSYIVRHTAPSFCMADIRDVNTDVSLVETGPGTFRSALFMFDAIEGGVGYSERIYHKIDECLGLCREIIGECRCGTGCPACIPPLPPGVVNEELESYLLSSNASAASALSLITALAEGKIQVPEIKFFQVPVLFEEKPPEDGERKDLGVRLTRAAEILKKKRERVH